MSFIADYINKHITQQQANSIYEKSIRDNMFFLAKILELPLGTNTFKVFNEYCTYYLKNKDNWQDYIISLNANDYTDIDNDMKTIKVYPNSLDKYIAVKYPNIKLSTY